MDPNLIVISKTECQELADIIERTASYDGYSRPGEGMSRQDNALMHSAGRKVVEYINNVTGAATSLDYLTLRRTPHAGVRAHADNAEWDSEAQSWKPNLDPQRTFSAVVLLSNRADYAGGTFRFHEPSREDFRPNIGNVLVFDASKLNVHSVDSIPSGIRQTLLVWVKGE